MRYMLLLTLLACGEIPGTEKRTEGMNPGECTDGADNDSDGVYDCEDSDCAAAPDCLEVDDDEDGVLEENDCDDNDPDLGSIDEDEDCDGVLSEIDCDDSSADVTNTIENDADCDLIATDIDCDDSSADVTNTNENDADCDLIATDIDCDDSSADVTNTNENDADCDLIATDIDCDDSSSDITNTNENDADCDLIATDIDCDDSSADVTNTNENDADCDLVTTDIDCDDSSADVTNTNENDADCDLVTTDIDCDDSSADITNSIDIDADCDSITSDLDCDDSSSDVTNTNENDADCDLITSDLDCDDSSTDVTNTNENDADCDLVTTDIDCDDSNSDITNTNENDADCDLVTTDIDCDDSSSDITNTNENDADCDLVTTDIDCDDSNSDITNTNENDADCDLVTTDIDCDDSSADITNSIDIDADCDSITSDLDCDDSSSDVTNTNENDADCDLITSDLDCDDSSSDITNTNENDADCDLVTTDIDCDDSSSDVTNTNENDADCDLVATDIDCDDSSAETVNTNVDDADCDLASSDIDCDDNDAHTYPGAAELDSTTACMTDADEDGYGDAFGGFTDCFTIEMFDSYGDSTFGSWSGGNLTVSVDGEFVDIDDSLEDCIDETLCDITGGGWYGTDPSSYKSQEVCYSGASEVVVTYTTPSYYAGEVGYRITAQDGTVWAEEGYIDGVEATDKSWTFESDIIKGTDCDDNDAIVGSSDADGDGYDSCDSLHPRDCNDSDPAINPSIDADKDGFSACDECDDEDVDINPDASEIWYDGIDQNCDGLSDYDADMDGYDAMEYDDGTGTIIEYTGTDCDDSDDDLHPADLEADPDQCFQDKDDDGYGDMDLTNSEIEAGIIVGTDCDDSSFGGANTYPGAGYNETGTTDDGVVLSEACMTDGDLDGFGDDSPYAYLEITPGTDCFDSKYSWDVDAAFTFPGAAENETGTNEDGEIISELCLTDVDGDGLGEANALEDVDPGGTDCDDDDIDFGTGFWSYEDLDGDGFGDDNTLYYVCSLDTDDDGKNDLIEVGGDCDDTPATIDESTGETTDLGGTMTYPGAAENDSVVYCLTDNDGDGYGSDNGVAGLFEGVVLSGDTMGITITDAYGDSCTGTADIYVDYVWVASYEGPPFGDTDASISYSFVYDTDVFVQIGWTSGGYYNYECGLDIIDNDGNSLYSLTGCSSSTTCTHSGPVPTVPTAGGTDSNDLDATVH